MDTKYIYLVNVYDSYYPGADNTVAVYEDLELAQAELKRIWDEADEDQYGWGLNSYGYEHAKIFKKEVRNV